MSFLSLFVLGFFGGGLVLRLGGCWWWGWCWGWESSTLTYLTLTQSNYSKTFIIYATHYYSSSNSTMSYSYSFTTFAIIISIGSSCRLGPGVYVLRWCCIVVRLGSFAFLQARNCC